MEAANALQPITNHAIVRDRLGGQNRGDREAFQRAMKEHQAATPRADEDEAVAPVRPELQPEAVVGRRDGQAQHIDVLA